MAYYKKYRPRSTTPEARKYIQDAINDKFMEASADTHGVKSPLDCMEDDVNCGFNRFDRFRGLDVRKYSNYEKARNYCADGNMFVYTQDKAEFLYPIYGKDNVKSWSQNKIENTYDNLIAREYDSMIRTRDKYKK